MSSENITILSRMLKAIANSKRLEILYFLLEKENNVGELEQKMDLSQSALSQHLAILRKEEVVKTRRQAQTVYYSLKNAKIIKLMEFLKHL